MKKSIALVMMAVLLVAASVMGTLAYLTSTATVTNTFTVGKVAITLDEADVDVYGAPIENAARVRANEYKLIPGHAYTKDPTVHFAAGSEASWLFVKVENGIANIEADKKIADQIIDNGWKALTGVTGVDGVYYKQVDANNTAAAIDYPVFKTFKLDGEADVSKYANAAVKVTAYAIQADGFTTPDAAWAKFSN